MTDSPQKSLALLLDQIEQRASKATLGPWESRAQAVRKPEDGTFIAHAFTSGTLRKEEMMANRDFIAASRTDVVLLVKALRRAIKALEEPEASSDNGGHVRQNTRLREALSDARATFMNLGIDNISPVGIQLRKAAGRITDLFNELDEKKVLSGHVTDSENGSGSPKTVLSEITAILEGKEQQTLGEKDVP